MDHDQRFKTLIREFFESFLRLFFAEQAARIDFASVEWQDKELLPDLPPGMASSCGAMTDPPTECG